jgi:hypothetical protein
MIAWESARQGTIADGDREILHCYVGTTEVGDWQNWGALQQNVAIRDWGTTTANAYIHVMQAPDDPSRFILYGDLIEFQSALEIYGVSWTRITGINIRHDSSQNVNAVDVALGATNVLLDSIWFQSWPGAQGTNLIGLKASWAPSLTVRNCWFRGFTNGFVPVTENDVINIENCTLVQMSTGIGYGVNTNMWNNVCHGNTTWQYAQYFASWSGTATNNASSDTSAPGTSPVHGTVDGDFVDLANNDIHPTEGGNLDGTGADLSGKFTHDFDGVERTVPWEIGAYAIPAASGVTFDGPDIVAQSGTEWHTGSGIHLR